MASENPFSNIGFEDFRRFALDSSLSKYEKIGFPNSYRKGFEEIIWSDILEKLNLLNKGNCCVLEIGPGCSDLPLLMINLCSQKNNRLILIDSSEMLSLLPDASFIEKIPAVYPNCPDLIQRLKESVDVILCYSVLHYIFVDTAFFRFLDTSLSLLSPGGQMLIGDIPNISKRKRFFSSDAGVKFHQQFTNTASRPEIAFNCIQHDQIDDSVIFSLIGRARSSGFDAYVVPQNPKLPMANRREDILITRP
jgi:hypothetical protein